MSEAILLTLRQQEQARNFFKVYSGKANRCMCGCSGKWTVTENVAANHPDICAVSNRSVRIIVNKILRSGNIKTDFPGKIYAEVDGRIYLAQFEE